MNDMTIKDWIGFILIGLFMIIYISCIMDHRDQYKYKEGFTEGYQARVDYEYGK